MANSKHAHLRYNILDYCFRYKALNSEQLLEYVNDKIIESYPGETISIRTLREDIKLFKDPVNGFGAPLPMGARILQYSDKNFSIASKPLLPFENYLIEASQQLLERYENHPKYNRLSEALIKFQDEENQEDRNTNKVMFFDHNDEYKGIKYLKPLYLAIQKKQVLNIYYRPDPELESNMYAFHPHILKQYNRRWFVFGLNDKHEIWEWSIPLDDRLVSFELNSETEYKESGVDWNNHFRNLVGVRRSNQDKLHFIKLKFNSKNRLNLFRSKPLVPDFDDSLVPGEENVVHFESIINPELVQQILSYGKDIEVLEPKELIDELRIHALKMKELYSQ